MLKQSATARKTTTPARSATGTVRIQGVSASKNIKIGLVSSSSKVTPKVELQAETETFAKPQAAVAPQIAPVHPVRERAKKLNAVMTSAIKPFLAQAAAQLRLAREAISGAVGRLSLLALAAAGLTVAAAMLMHFQFSTAAPQSAPSIQADYSQFIAATAAAPAPIAGAAQAEVPAAPAPAMVEDALMARITAGTLEALRSKPGSAAQAQPTVATPAEDGSALYQMVRAAAAQGQSAAYIDQLVNGAYQRQEISVPASLISADGRVDTATLLTLFIGG